MEYKDGCVGRHVIDFPASVGIRRSAELKLTPPTDDAYPLLVRRTTVACSLSIRHGVGERRHAVPTKLQIVIESAPN